MMDQEKLEQVDQSEIEQASTSVNPDNSDAHRDVPVSQVTPPPSPKAPRKRKSLMMVLVIIFLLLLGGAGGVFAYKAYFEPKTADKDDTSTTSSSTKTTASTSSQTAKELTVAMQALAGGTKIAVASTSERLALTADNYVAYSVPSYQPSGYSFTTAPSTLYGTATVSATQAQADTDYTAFNTYLAAAGFTAENTVTGDVNNNIVAGVEYHSDAVYCTLSETSYQSKYQSSVGCADVSSYVANAKAVQPLYTTYIAAHPDQSVDGAYFGFFNYTKSKVSGYASAWVNAGSSAAIFYQTTDSKWHYFMNSQQELLCSEYSTTDLKNAFLGTSCFTADSKESTVSL